MEEHQLTGHDGSVLCARVFRGRLLFSGSVDGTVKVGLQCHTVAVGSRKAAGNASNPDGLQCPLH